jgi:WD40 repeat protein
MLVKSLSMAVFLCGTAVAEPIKCIGHTGMVESVAFSPDGGTVVSGGIDPLVRVWDAATGKQLHELPISATQDNPPTVISVVFSPNGKTIAVTTVDMPITFWDSETGMKQEEGLLHKQHARSVIFSPDGSKLGVVVGNSIRIWDLKTKKIVFDVVRNIGPQKVIFSPDGTLLVADSGDIWKWATGETVFENQWLSPKPGTWWIPGQAIAFSPDGKYLVGAGDGFVEWDWAERKQTLRQPDGKFFCVAVSSDGKTIATGGADGLVKLWDFDTGRFKQNLARHTDQVTGISFSPDGKRLASASRDKTVLISTLETEEGHSGR